MPTLITLLDRYDPLLFGLIYEEIERKVDHECRGQFTEPKLAALLEWLTGGVLAWVSRIYARSVEGGQEEAKKMLKPTFSRFEYHVNKVLCALRCVHRRARLRTEVGADPSNCRTTELWDMIVEYPNSLPALEDLKVRPAVLPVREGMLTRSRYRSASTRQTSARCSSPGYEPRTRNVCYIPERARATSSRTTSPQSSASACLMPRASSSAASRTRSASTSGALPSLRSFLPQTSNVFRWIQRTRRHNSLHRHVAHRGGQRVRRRVVFDRRSATPGRARRGGELQRPQVDARSSRRAARCVPPLRVPALNA